MIFKSLFKPKWKNSNPQVRRQALRDMDPSVAENQAIFRDILKNDLDPVVRQTVLRHVADLSILSELVRADSDATVREHAVQRLRRLLTGNDSESPSVDERCKFLEAQGDTKLLEFIARQAKEVKLREALMLYLARDSLYGDIALQDPDPDLRYKALGYISQRATLERVLKGARNKDKRVRLAAQERLADIKAEEERPEQLKQQVRLLCARLDSLLVALKAEPDSIRLRAQRQEIDQEWQVLHTAWHSESLGSFDEKLTERYKRACDMADQLLRGYAEQAERKAAAERMYEPIREEKERIYAVLSETLRQVEAQENFEDSTLPQLLDTLALADVQWQAAGVLPAEEARKTDQAFKDLANTLRRRAEDIKRYLKAIEICEKIIQKATSEDLRDLEGKRLSTIEKLWGSIEYPQSMKLPDTLLAHVQSLIDGLRVAKQKKEYAREKALSTFEMNLDALEKALIDGKSKPALSLTRQLANNLKGISNQDIKDLRDSGAYARYQRATGQLKELRDWQGWAANPMREDLCQEIETIGEEIQTYGQSPAYDFHAASKKIQRARQRWKSLGFTEGEEGEELWERFNTACNRAYEPCQKFFDQEAESREQNLVAKEALCSELEHYFSAHVEDKDESEIDWKRLDRVISAALLDWKKIGPVHRHGHVVVRDRFNGIIRRMKAVLKAERNRNKEQKEQLIINAEKVAASLVQSEKSPNVLRDSAAAIKLLQASWKEIGYATEERKVWARFRAACDSVFNERQAQFDFLSEERRANLAKKEALCDLVERVVDLADEELKNAQSRIEEIRGEWKDIGEVPRDASQAIEQRFETAYRYYKQALKKQTVNEKTNERQKLYHKHELCVQLDVLTDEFINAQVKVDEAIVRLENIKTIWEGKLSDSNPDDEVALALQARYQYSVTRLNELVAQGGNQANSGVTESLRKIQRESLVSKLEWCLALEILAGVDSPPEYEQARMALQVQMLARKHGNDTDAHLANSVTEIENNWYMTDSPPALEAIQLERRFVQARRMLLPGSHQNQIVRSVSA